MKIFLSAVLALFLVQDQNYWTAMADVDFKIRKSPEGYEIPYPEFGDKAKALSGKKITLKGYIIPLDEFRGQSYFMFSSLPFNSCFFVEEQGLKL